MDDKQPQVVGRVYKGGGNFTHGALNSVGRALPDGAPLYAEAVTGKAREVLQEMLDDIDEALEVTAVAVGKGSLRVNGEPLTPEQEAERMSGLWMKRRKVAEVLK